MKSRFWLLLSVLIVATFVFAACSPSQGAAPSPTAAPVGAAPTTEPGTVATTAAVTSTTTTTTTVPGPAATSAMTGTTPITGTAPAAAVPLMDPAQAALQATGGKKIGGSVSVLGAWGGPEQQAFLAMVKPFEDATGVQVNYTGSRDTTAILATRVQGGNPPDVVDMPNPGEIAKYTGKLVDLSTVLDMNALKQQYSQSWLDLADFNGKLVGLGMKAAVKGLIWYDPKVWQSKGFQQPKTWQDLVSLSTQMANGGTAAWCIGLANGAASGWPGTDWLEDIVLRQSGPQVYNDWWAGKVAWTSPQIKQAWQTWGQIVGNAKLVYGGPNYMLSTDFSSSGTPLFTNPPGCYMVHQGSFMAGFFTSNNASLKAGQDFDFFGFPSFDPSAAPAVETSGDLVVMFNNTPQAQGLIKWLATPEAQDIWTRQGGGYLAPNKNVPLSDYPDDLTRKQAQLLQSSQVAVFDASDQMPAALNTAFWQAILQYVQNPGSLDSILQHLDSVSKTAYGK